MLTPREYDREGNPKLTLKDAPRLIGSWLLFMLALMALAAAIVLAGWTLHIFLFMFPPY